MMRPASFALVALALALTGCDGNAPVMLADAGRSLGVTERAPRPSRTVTILIDPTLQSPASVDAVAAVIDTVLPDLATRPTPSCVQLWAMGATVNDLRSIGQACVGERERNTRAQTKAEERFIRTAREHLLGLAQPVFAARPRQSPIAESVSRVAEARTNSRDHVLVVITDGREESGGVAKLECGPLPTPAAFATALQKEWLLEPESLAGIDVHFAFMGFSDANRPGCATSVRREKELRNLWRTAFERASARSIAFSSGVPQIAVEEVSR